MILMIIIVKVLNFILKRLVACYFVKDIVKYQRSGLEPRTKFDGVFWEVLYFNFYQNVW